MNELNRHELMHNTLHIERASKREKREQWGRHILREEEGQGEQERTSVSVVLGSTTVGVISWPSRKRNMVLALTLRLLGLLGLEFRRGLGYGPGLLGGLLNGDIFRAG